MKVTFEIYLYLHRSVDKSTYIIALLARRFKHTGWGNNLKFGWDQGSTSQTDSLYIQRKWKLLSRFAFLQWSVDKSTYIIALLARWNSLKFGLDQGSTKSTFSTFCRNQTDSL